MIGLFNVCRHTSITISYLEDSGICWNSGARRLIQYFLLITSGRYNLLANPHILSQTQDSVNKFSGAGRSCAVSGEKENRTY